MIDCMNGYGLESVIHKTTIEMLQAVTYQECMPLKSSHTKSKWNSYLVYSQKKPLLKLTVGIFSLCLGYCWGAIMRYSRISFYGMDGIRRDAWPSFTLSRFAAPHTHFYVPTKKHNPYGWWYLLAVLGYALWFLMLLYSPLFIELRFNTCPFLSLSLL